MLPHWFCGAPLTALITLSAAFQHIAGNQTTLLWVKCVVLLYCQLCITFSLIPFEQVGVGIPLRSWSAIAHWMLFSQLLVLTDLCCFMVGILMNAVIPLFFPDVTISAFPELFAWIQWYYCCVLCFGSYCILSKHYWY